MRIITYEFNPFTAEEKSFFEKNYFSLSGIVSAASKQLFFVANLVYFQKIRSRSSIILARSRDNGRQSCSQL